MIPLGGTQFPLGEADTYRGLLSLLRPDKPFGRDFKELMRSSVLRDRMCGIQMIGEDLPYRDNTVDLDPHVKDFGGRPVAADVRTNRDVSSGRVYIILLDDLNVAPLRTGIVRKHARDVTA